MTTVLTTLFQQHNLSMVAVAAVICGLSSFTSIGLIDRARKSQGTRRLGWIVVAALGVGFGIWSTHFIAMLAYVPGIAIGYQPTGTVASLLVAIITAGAGFFLASNSTNRSDLLLGGIVVGFGITGMHYLGMASLRIGGTIEWDNGLVAVSVILASALSASAMMVGARRSGWRSRVGASATLTAAIVSLHSLRWAPPISRTASQ